MKFEKPLTRQEFRTALGVSATTFWRLEKAGLLPTPILRSGRKLVLWAARDVALMLGGQYLPEIRVVDDGAATRKLSNRCSTEGDQDICPTSKRAAA